MIIFGALFPVFLFLAFAIGRDIPLDHLAPGLIGMALFFTASATTLTVFPFETRTRTLERLLASPIHLGTLIAGDILAAFLFGMLLSLIPVALSLTALGADLHHPFLLISAVILSGLCFSMLGSLLSTPATDDPASIMTLANLVRLPLIFVSRVFIPLREMPVWGSALSRLSPLTYATEALRGALGQEAAIGSGISLAMICLFLVLFWLAALLLHRRNIGKRLWT